jgi:O-antigen/teichoic acid export membrane protein
VCWIVRPYSQAVVREELGGPPGVGDSRGGRGTLAQRVAFNTGIQVVGLVLGIFLSFAFLRLATGYLGVNAFGELAVVLTLGGLIVTLADFGINTTLAREVSKHPDDRDRLAGTLLSFRFAGAAAISVLVLLALPFTPYPHALRVALAVSLFGVFFTSVGTFPKAFFQVNLSLQRQAALDLTQKVLNVAVLLVAIWVGLGLLALVALLAAVNLVVAVCSFVLARRYWRFNVRWRWTRQSRRLIRSSLTIGLVSMIGLLHYRGDAVLLSLLKPAKDVGIYSIAYRFVDQAFVLPGLLMAAIFPTLTRYANDSDRDRRDRLVNKTFQVLLLSAVFVAIAVFTLSPLLITWIAGDDFLAAIEPAQILAFSIVFLFVSPVFYNLLIAIDRQRALVVLGLVALTLNVILTLSLIPRYSYNGAAVATVVSEGFTFFATLFLCRRLASARIDAWLVVRVGMATIAALSSVALMRGDAAWLSFAVAEGLFIVFAFGVRAITQADLRLLFERGAH